jgi:hypothetical protein
MIVTGKILLSEDIRKIKNFREESLKNKFSIWFLMRKEKIEEDGLNNKIFNILNF